MSKQPSQSDMPYVRAAELDDYVALTEVYAQPRACANTLQMPLPSVEIWRERLTHRSPLRTVLVACVDDRVVGNIGLMRNENPRRAHAGSIGMGVHDDYAGRGVGRALLTAALDLADNWLNLQRVELTVFADNHRAINLYRDTGFLEEGVFRRFAFRQGELVDALSMARPRPS
ncbi:MAG: GNAT family N-acetyltransferase [Pseudomonadota bacterium]